VALPQLGLAVISEYQTCPQVFPERGNRMIMPLLHDKYTSTLKKYPLISRWKNSDFFPFRPNEELLRHQNLLIMTARFVVAI
jgi:hypothetical protein